MPKTIRFRVELTGVSPAIWRTFEVGEEETFLDMHDIIQIVMGWENYHLFEFIVNEKRLGPIDEEEPGFEEDAELEDCEEWALEDIGLKKGDSFMYIYDFGDSWEHLVTVEDVFEKSTELPVCLDGKRNCPPEDCGGPWGYEGLLEALRDPKHPEHKNLLEWLGEPFDPEEFDVALVNELLNEFHEWRQDEDGYAAGDENE